MSNTKFIINPFPGIRSFEPDEDFLFFGRDQQIKDVLGLLSSTHFLALIGYSGSGKSSLIKAGIIPGIIKSSPVTVAEGEWATIYFRPGGKPFESLATALLDATGFVADDENDELVPNTAYYLQHKAGTLKNVYDHYKHEKEKNWLIVIDQFEELFRFRNREENQTEDHISSQRFIDLLLSGLSDLKLPVYIIVSMRSDFLDSCTEFDHLPEAINKGSYLLPKVSQAGIREIITEPVAVCNATISSNLVSRLLLDLKDNLDQLPVLQHAMMRTWDHWKLNQGSGKEISDSDYESVGTMDAALSIHAEEIYQNLGERKQKIAEKIFKTLTDVTIDNKGTRRPVQLSELAKIANVGEHDIADVVDEFRAQGRAFLMPVYTVALHSDTVVDIAHESIMRVWARLRDWVYAEEKSAELYLRLSKAASLYQEGKGGLWVDPDLALAMKWQQDNSPGIAWATRYDPAFERAIQFLEYSSREFQFKTGQKARKQANELKNARRNAVIWGSAFILSIVLVVIAFNLQFSAKASAKHAIEDEKKLKAEGIEADLQKKQAILQQKIAEQQQSIAAQQQTLAEEQKLTAINASTIAEQRKKEAEFQKVLAINQRDSANYQKTRADSQALLAAKNEKQAKNYAQTANTEKLKAEAAGMVIDTLRLLSEANAIAFKANQLLGDAQQDTLSLQLAFLSYAIFKKYRRSDQDQSRAVYDAVKAQLNHYYNKELKNNFGVPPNTGTYDYRGVVFNHANDFFTAGDDGFIKEWQIKTDPYIQVVIRKTSKNIGESIHDISLSGDKRSLLGRTASGHIAIWEVNNITAPPLMLNNNTNAQYAVFLPAIKNDEYIFVKDDRYAYMYSFTKTTTKLLNRYALCKGTENGTFSTGCINTKGDNTTVYVSQGKSVCALKFNSTYQLIAMNTEFTSPGNISAMILGNKNNMIVGTETGTILIYKQLADNSFEKNPSERIFRHSSRITGLSLLPIEKGSLTIASGSLDNTVLIEKWKTDNKQTDDLIFKERKGWVRGISTSSNGRYLVSVGQSGMIQLFPMNEEVLVKELTSYPANKKILSSPQDKRLKVELGDELYNRLVDGPSINSYWNKEVKKYMNN